MTENSKTTHTTTYKSNPNRIKNLNMNCSPEEGQQIVEKFGEQAFNEFKSMDLLYPGFSLQSCINEFKNLREKPGKLTSSSSRIIKTFHKSILLANKKGHMSPIDAWNYLKTDYEAFKKFFYNRITRSDWFKVDDRMDTWARKGKVPQRIYSIGLTTGGFAPTVGYFKPRIAKYLLEKYAPDARTIMDPFSGYSGRMLGTLAAGKSYYGQDINDLVVKESNNIIEFLKENFKDLPKARVVNKNTLEDNSSLHEINYDVLLACPPYSDKEEWPGNIVYKTCDEWIDECLERFNCKTYIFIVDSTISEHPEYKNDIKEPLTNTSHWGSNSEQVVVINT